MVFGNGVKNIQAAAYNGARTVFSFDFPENAYLAADLSAVKVKRLCKIGA